MSWESFFNINITQWKWNEKGTSVSLHHLLQQERDWSTEPGIITTEERDSVVFLLDGNYGNKLSKEFLEASH